eukprot:TRINITY_DN2497_c0_g1_i3.p1 TRINITY_DN2497_c0_g1~~TRINITY_DN2497_c0_g1_i3.p1  ORF type:complete len:363 (-),score=49.37 TRINITY_DN2497_c0_g1_i3:77-1165(-)
MGQEKARYSVLYDSSIIATTCMGSYRNSLREIRFDYVIVDDAQKANIPELFIPLSQVKVQAILIGDSEQPGPNSQIPEMCKSMFKLLIKRLKYPASFLTTTYHLPTMVCDISSGLFYGGHLQHDPQAINSYAKISPAQKGPLMLINCLGEEEVVGDSYINEAEAVCIKDLIRTFLKNGVGQKKISVITYTLEQKYNIMMRCEELKDVRIETTEAFQYHTNEYVIVSCVRSSMEGDDIGSLGKAERLNNVLTRATRSLIIVGNARNLYRNQNWRNFIDKHFDAIFCEGLGDSPTALTSSQVAEEEKESSLSHEAESDDEEYGWTSINEGGNSRRGSYNFGRGRNNPRRMRSRFLRRRNYALHY